jgi:molybdate transport system substrate-binding protein
MRPLGATLLALLLSACAPSPQPELLIAAASDLRFAMDDLAALFEQQHPGLTIRVSYGSSGQFFSQIQNGAPYDLYCSADIAYPRQLAAAGLVLPDTEFTYATGRIALWVPNESPLDLQRLGIDALRDPSVRHIAIANPQHAPYGRAAVAAMKSLGVYDAVAPQLAYGENISQTLQYIQQRSADIGIVALSLALAPPIKATGRYWEIPRDAYPPLVQGGVIPKWSKNPDAARQFRDFLLRPEAEQVFAAYGFTK